MTKHNVADAPAGKGAANEDILALRAKRVLPFAAPYYAKPLQIVRGRLQHVYDEAGREYLDAFAGIVTISIGHSHPHFVKKVTAQVAELYHTTMLYLHPSLGQAADMLVAKARAANPELEVCFFVNSGGEANELAAMLAKNHTKRHEFIALRHSYHGRTLMAASLSGQSAWHHSTPYVYGVSHAPANYTYRRPEGLTPEQYAGYCVRELEETIKYSTSGQIAAFIAEPIMGVGGVIDPEPGYFPAAYAAIKKAGGLYISDEVQTGVGRTGRKFLGIEQWGVKPDIVTMAKGLANGHPIGAVITTRAIAESMRGLNHLNTFGGGPVAMAAVTAVLETLDAEKLSENAHVVGAYLKEKLQGLLERSPWVGDVRGKGLMLGLELVESKKTKEPSPAKTLKILDLVRERGVLIGKGGMAGNVLRIKPPLCFTKKDSDKLVGALEESLKEL